MVNLGSNARGAPDFGDDDDESKSDCDGDSFGDASDGDPLDEIDSDACDNDVGTGDDSVWPASSDCETVGSVKKKNCSKSDSNPCIIANTNMFPVNPEKENIVDKCENYIEPDKNSSRLVSQTCSEEKTSSKRKVEAPHNNFRNNCSKVNTDIFPMNKKNKNVVDNSKNIVGMSKARDGLLATDRSKVTPSLNKNVETSHGSSSVIDIYTKKITDMFNLNAENIVNEKENYKKSFDDWVKKVFDDSSKSGLKTKSNPIPQRKVDSASSNDNESHVACATDKTVKLAMNTDRKGINEENPDHGGKPNDRVKSLDNVATITKKADNTGKSGSSYGRDTSAEVNHDKCNVNVEDKNVNVNENVGEGRSRPLSSKCHKVESVKTRPKDSINSDSDNYESCGTDNVVEVVDNGSENTDDDNDFESNNKIKKFILIASNQNKMKRKRENNTPSPPLTIKKKNSSLEDNKYIICTHGFANSQCTCNKKDSMSNTACESVRDAIPNTLHSLGSMPSIVITNSEFHSRDSAREQSLNDRMPRIISIQNVTKMFSLPTEVNKLSVKMADGPKDLLKDFHQLYCNEDHHHDGKHVCSRNSNVVIKEENDVISTDSNIMPSEYQQCNTVRNYVAPAAVNNLNVETIEIDDDSSSSSTDIAKGSEPQLRQSKNQCSLSSNNLKNNNQLGIQKQVVTKIEQPSNNDVETIEINDDSDLESEIPVDSTTNVSRVPLPKILPRPRKVIISVRRRVVNRGKKNPNNEIIEIDDDETTNESNSINDQFDDNKDSFCTTTTVQNEKDLLEQLINILGENEIETIGTNTDNQVVEQGLLEGFPGIIVSNSNVQVNESQKILTPPDSIDQTTNAKEVLADTSDFVIEKVSKAGVLENNLNQKSISQNVNDKDLLQYFADTNNDFGTVDNLLDIFSDCITTGTCRKDSDVNDIEPDSPNNDNISDISDLDFDSLVQDLLLLSQSKESEAANEPTKLDSQTIDFVDANRTTEDCDVEEIDRESDDNILRTENNISISKNNVINNLDNESTGKTINRDIEKEFMVFNHNTSNTVKSLNTKSGEELDEELNEIFEEYCFEKHDDQIDDFNVNNETCSISDNSNESSCKNQLSHYIVNTNNIMFTEGFGTELYIEKQLDNYVSNNIADIEIISDEDSVICIETDIFDFTVHKDECTEKEHVSSDKEASSSPVRDEDGDYAVKNKTTTEFTSRNEHLEINDKIGTKVDSNIDMYVKYKKSNSYNLPKCNIVEKRNKYTNMEVVIPDYQLVQNYVDYVLKHKANKILGTIVLEDNLDNMYCLLESKKVPDSIEYGTIISGHVTADDKHLVTDDANVYDDNGINNGEILVVNSNSDTWENPIVTALRIINNDCESMEIEHDPLSDVAVAGNITVLHNTNHATENIVCNDLHASDDNNEIGVSDRERCSDTANTPLRELNGHNKDNEHMETENNINNYVNNCQENCNDSNDINRIEEIAIDSNLHNNTHTFSTEQVFINNVSASADVRNIHGSDNTGNPIVTALRVINNDDDDVCMESDEPNDDRANRIEYLYNEDVNIEITRNSVERIDFDTDIPRDLSFNRVDNLIYDGCEEKQQEGSNGSQSLMSVENKLDFTELQGVTSMAESGVNYAELIKVSKIIEASEQRNFNAVALNTIKPSNMDISRRCCTPERAVLNAVPPPIMVF